MDYACPNSCAHPSWAFQMLFRPIGKHHIVSSQCLQCCILSTNWIKPFFFYLRGCRIVHSHIPILIKNIKKKILILFFSRNGHRSTDPWKIDQLNNIFHAELHIFIFFLVIHYPSVLGDDNSLDLYFHHQEKKSIL